MTTLADLLFIIDINFIKLSLPRSSDSTYTLVLFISIAQQLEVDIRVQSPYIVVPENGFYSRSVYMGTMLWVCVALGISLSLPPPPPPHPPSLSTSFHAYGSVTTIC